MYNNKIQISEINHDRSVLKSLNVTNAFIVSFKKYIFNSQSEKKIVISIVQMEQDTQTKN